MSTSFLGMSDEDFLKEQAPAVEPAGSSEPQEIQQVSDPEPAQNEPANDQGSDGASQTQGDDSIGEEIPDAPASSAPQNDPHSGSPELSPGSEAKPDPAKDGTAQEPSQGQEAQTTAPDYKAFYEKIMTPFKANGRMIELRSPDEAISLMQMGADYTRKMQSLAPYRKVIMMLENHQLLDEAKLSFAIDLVNKNPEAIKKLVKDAGIDPLDMDMSSEPAYREGNHRVSDEEAAFRTALENVQASPLGVETLNVINTDWDQASKELLWKQPEAIEVIRQHRELGVYARITDEMNRLKVLGRIPAHVPFLEAYKAIGDQMLKANAFADIQQGTPGNSQNPALSGSAPAAQQPVATRTSVPKSTVSNSDKASAAMPARNTPQTRQALRNPLSMPDDEFLKQFANRL